jgi:predicted DNA-binding WGR domain protein
MKLIKQTILVYREGKSDKVYEVDLCEVGADRYVVNFRYGRRGTSLKEGSKTSGAVARGAADRVFSELVSSKMKKGYREAGDAPGQETVPRRRVAANLDEDARNQAVLNLLADSHNGKKKKSWPIERAIWRAGELCIRAAAPLLIDLIGSGGALRDYCIAWALGWCGDESALAPLRKLYNAVSASDGVRRIAAEALLKLYDDDVKAAFRSDLIGQLPEPLSSLARSGPAEELQAALAAHLAEGDAGRFAALDHLYLIDNENTRPALLEIIRTAPLRPNYFQRLRHIFKAAEYRRDAEVFGLLAYRFEKSRAMFNNTHFRLDRDRRYSYLLVENRYIQDGRKEVQSASSSIAYGSKTRSYLRRRVWRALRRMGELGEADYVKMAAGVLLAYSDADAHPAKQASYYDWRTRETRAVFWDSYAPYRAFNHILYGNSPRYVLRPNSTAWRCSQAYKPGDPAPQTREEAFPGLWEKVPVGLLHLISESDCRPVLEFAARALADCKQFCADLDNEVVVMILARPYEVTARLGLRLARDHYRPAEPDRDLVLALANAMLDEARDQSRRWIDDNRYHFNRDSDFLAELVTSRHSDIREYSRRLLVSSSLEESVERALIARIIAHLLALDAAQGDHARDVADTLLKCFSVRLRTLGMNVVVDLLAHPLMEVQELGANILLGHDIRADRLPESVIDSLIASPFESMRGAGIKLFGQLSDETLLGREALIARFAAHELADIRDSIRPVIRHLSERDDRFAARLAQSFIQALLAPEPHEGVHNSLVKIMQEDLGDGWKEGATRGTVWKLIQSKSQAAQELGGNLIEFKLGRESDFAQGFDTAEIVELSGREVLAVRRASRQIFAKIIDRFTRSMNPEGHLEEMAKAVRLLDSRWDDSRNHWLDTFRASFTAEDFTPAILVSICDSVREDVQQLGRELITRFFQEESGPEYLLKLSEHPSADLQLFATNYLERYAANDPARLRQMKPYFISVLSRVNRARVAKDRVLEFLTAEAEKSEQSAGIVADVLTRQSVTIAIGDRAAAIEAMLRIRQAYPQIKLPITVREPEVRNAV